MAVSAGPQHEPVAHEHGPSHEDCPQCLVSPPRAKGASPRLPWVVAGVAVAALVAVLVMGALAPGGPGLAFASLPLLAVLACPVGMGAMMWFMMRKH